jgi:phosphatidylglycerol:prolipoprotein diacylglycerol transferase
MIDGFQLGPLYIRFYGIILMLGAVAGGWLASRELKRRGSDPEMVWDLLVYLIIGGVIGARLWHIFTPPPSSIAQGFTTQYYLTHPLDALAIWRGGLGIPGTIIGGLIALYIFTLNNKAISFFEWTDIAAPSLALGQAIGRWGNFFNQELYGAPTNLPWKLYIDPAHRLAGNENIAYYHPLFAYESILNLANMLFLMWVSRQYAEKLKKGDVFNLYLIFYPVVRFFLDFLRLDASKVFSVNINQTLSAVVAICAVLVWFWRHRPGETEDLSVQMTSVSSLVEVTPKIETKTPTKHVNRKPAARKPAAKTSSKKTVVRKPASTKRVSKKPIAKKSSS